MSEVIDIEKQKQTVKPPKQYQCVLLNDDYTTIEFVVAILKRLFNKTEEQAIMIGTQVHRDGRGVVGVYSKDIAESKAMQVCVVAQNNDQPLQCITEPVDDE